MNRSLRTASLVGVAVFLARCAGCGGEDVTCPSGETECHGTCVDLLTSELDCGSCAHPCATGATCNGGACECPTGQVECQGACVWPSSFETDGGNCGACGVACGLGTCVGGACQCAPGATYCAATLPRCVDGTSDPEHCGRGVAACTTRCALANEVCVSGSCTCPAGTTECPAASPIACVDLQTDEANCGQCGNPCATGATCTSGACLCPQGESVCGGACVNRSTDEANCGACSWVCASGATCTGGSCVCPSAQPRLCGTPGSGGTCCAGSGCCTGGGGETRCQTEHTNGTGVAGLGQHFYDCLPLGTYDLTQAEKAARAWQQQGTAIPGDLFLCPTCLGWHATVGGIEWCGTWCYAGPLAGRAMLQQSLVCGCPLAGTANWN